jgi:predicted dehydrogenase
VRFGLVGAGYWAARAHAPALRDAAGAELVGIWGRHAQELAAQHGVRAYEDVDELIGSVDALSFAVPPDVQAPIAVRAAEAGRHLLLEKPIAFTVEDADRIVAAVDAANVAALVFLTARFRPETADWIATARDTAWTAANGRWLGAALTGDTPFARSAWRQQRGGLWDLGPHALSMLEPLLGPVRSVSAVAGPDDLVNLILTHEKGQTSSVSFTLRAPAELDSAQLTLWGPHGETSKPPETTPGAEALRVALETLTAMGETGVTAHPCDVAFGRDIVSVLAEADRQLATAHPARPQVADPTQKRKHR